MPRDGGRRARVVLAEQAKILIPRGNNLGTRGVAGEVGDDGTSFCEQELPRRRGVRDAGGRAIMLDGDFLDLVYPVQVAMTTLRGEGLARRLGVSERQHPPDQFADAWMTHALKIPHLRTYTRTELNGEEGLTLTAATTRCARRLRRTRR